MARLLLLFILVPIVELALLLEMGSRIGLVPTLALILATGVVGAYLARQQGLGVLRLIQEDMAQGRLPAGPMFDGLIILVAAALLVTPGILTDVVGFLLLIPGSRGVLKRAAWERVKKAVHEGRVRYEVHVDKDAWSGSEPIDVTPRQPGSDDSQSGTERRLPRATSDVDPTA